MRWGEVLEQGKGEENIEKMCQFVVFLWFQWFRLLFFSSFVHGNLRYPPQSYPYK